jgi:hypothetical protein
VSSWLALIGCQAAFPLAGKQLAELCLLIIIKLQVAQGQHVRIREQFDRYIRSGAIEPLNQDILNAAVGVHGYGTRPLNEWLREIQGDRFTHHSHHGSDGWH